MLGLSPYCTFIAHVPYPRTTPNEGLRRPANFHHVEHRDGKTKMRFKIVCCILGKAHIGKSTWALLANQVHLYICSYIHIFYIQMVRFNSYANLPDGTFCYLSVSSSQWKWLEFMDLMKETSQWPAWKSYKIMKTEAIWRYPWPPMSHISGWFWTVQWWSMTSRSPFSTVPGPRFWAETRWSDLIFDTCLVLQFSYWHKIHKSQTLPNSVDCSSCFLSNSMHRKVPCNAAWNLPQKPDPGPGSQLHQKLFICMPQSKVDLGQDDSPHCWATKITPKKIWESYHVLGWTCWKMLKTRRPIVDRMKASARILCLLMTISNSTWYDVTAVTVREPPQSSTGTAVRVTIPKYPKVASPCGMNYHSLQMLDMSKLFTWATSSANKWFSITTEQKWLSTNSCGFLPMVIPILITLTEPPRMDPT
jgi:hypothetical protein